MKSHTNDTNGSTKMQQATAILKHMKNFNQWLGFGAAMASGIRQLIQNKAKAPFSEHPVSTNVAAQKEFFEKPRVNDLYQDMPKLNIKPIHTTDPSSDDVPSDPIFNQSYLSMHHAFLENDAYLARGDNRTPQSLDYLVQPKCESLSQPHYNVDQHRGASDCSGMVSLTDQMRVAHHFGGFYQKNEDDGYYIFIAHMQRGLWLHPAYDRLPLESEHTATGPVQIMSYRQCHSAHGIFKCGNIFTRNDIDPKLQQKITEAQLLPFESLAPRKP